MWLTNRRLLSAFEVGITRAQSPLTLEDCQHANVLTVDVEQDKREKEQHRESAGRCA
jgi:hypothetical protein